VAPARLGAGRVAALAAAGPRCPRRACGEARAARGPESRSAEMATPFKAAARGRSSAWCEACQGFRERGRLRHSFSFFPPRSLTVGRRADGRWPGERNRSMGMAEPRDGRCGGRRAAGGSSCWPGGGHVYSTFHDLPADPRGAEPETPGSTPGSGESIHGRRGGRRGGGDHRVAGVVARFRTGSGSATRGQEGSCSAPNHTAVAGPGGDQPDPPPRIQRAPR